MCLGMTCSIFGLVIASDFRVNISFVDPTYLLLVPRTCWSDGVICYCVVCRGEELITWPMIKRFLLLRWVLGSIEGKSLLEKVMVTGSETVDSDTDETRSVCFGQCFFLRWICYVMNQSWRRLWEMIYELLVLFHDNSQNRQDECHGWRSGDIEGAFLELMMILISFQNVSLVGNGIGKPMGILHCTCTCTNGDPYLWPAPVYPSKIIKNQPKMVKIWVSYGQNTPSSMFWS